MDIKANLLSLEPTFCLVIPEENGLEHIGLHSGDILMCDSAISPARFVIGSWDGLAHVCTNIDGHLFDEATLDFSPEDAKILGRVLYFSRALVPMEEGATA